MNSTTSKNFTVNTTNSSDTSLSTHSALYSRKSIQPIVPIFRKELASYFSSPVGYIFAIFYTLVSNGMFFIVQDFFRQGQVSMRAYFAIVPWIFLFFMPAITMRLWSEEKKLGTIEFLLTAPITEWQIILGKFFASLIFLCFNLACSLTVPITLSLLGDLDWGVVVGAYTGTVLMGASYLAIGLYFSSLTDNQVVAFIFSLVAIFLLLLIGIIPPYLDSVSILVPICNYLSLLTHFHNIARGVVDSRDIVYYTSIITLFLFLNVKNIQARKWR